MAQFGIYETRFDLQIFRVATVHPSNIELQRRKQRRGLFGYLKWRCAVRRTVTICWAEIPLGKVSSFVWQPQWTKFGPWLQSSKLKLNLHMSVITPIGRQADKSFPCSVHLTLLRTYKALRRKQKCCQSQRTWFHGSGCWIVVAIWDRIDWGYTGDMWNSRGESGSNRNQMGIKWTNNAAALRLICLGLDFRIGEASA